MSTEQDIRTFKEWWLWTMLDPISALDNIPFSSVLATIQFSSVLGTIPLSYVCDKSNTTTIQHGVIHSTLKSCFVMSSRNTDDSYDCPDDVWRQRQLQQCHYWCLPPDKSANCKQLRVCLTHGTPSVLSFQPWRNTVHSKNMLQWNAVKTKNTVYSKPSCLILNIGEGRHMERSGLQPVPGCCSPRREAVRKSRISAQRLAVHKQRLLLAGGVRLGYHHTAVLDLTYQR